MFFEYQPIEYPDIDISVIDDMIVATEKKISDTSNVIKEDIQSWVALQLVKHYFKTTKVIFNEINDFRINLS